MYPKTLLPFSAHPFLNTILTLNRYVDHSIGSLSLASPQDLAPSLPFSSHYFLNLVLEGISSSLKSKQWTTTDPRLEAITKKHVAYYLANKDELISFLEKVTLNPLFKTFEENVVPIWQHLIGQSEDMSHTIAFFKNHLNGSTQQRFPLVIKKIFEKENHLEELIELLSLALLKKDHTQAVPWIRLCTELLSSENEKAISSLYKHKEKIFPYIYNTENAPIIKKLWNNKSIILESIHVANQKMGPPIYHLSMWKDLLEVSDETVSKIVRQHALNSFKEEAFDLESKTLFTSLLAKNGVVTCDSIAIAKEANSVELWRELFEAKDPSIQKIVIEAAHIIIAKIDFSKRLMSFEMLIVTSLVKAKDPQTFELVKALISTNQMNEYFWEYVIANGDQLEKLRDLVFEGLVKKEYNWNLVRVLHELIRKGLFIEEIKAFYNKSLKKIHPAFVQNLKALLTS